MKQTLFVLMIILFTGINSLSQTVTISGDVRALKTNLPITGVKVSVKNNDTQQLDSVFTDASGNWQYSVVTSAEDEQFNPYSFKVLQNYPNPFNPSTRIGFYIPRDGFVEVTVHSIYGELIDLRSGYLSAGNYSIDWYSRSSAGVYLYTIRFGDVSYTKKMIQLDGGSGKGLTEFRAGVDYLPSAPSMKTISGSLNLQIVFSKIPYAADTLDVAVNGGENFSTLLETVHDKYTLVDLHNDIIEKMVNDPTYRLGTQHNFNHTDIPRMEYGDVDIQFFSLWVHPTTYTGNYYNQTIVMRDILNSELTANPSRMRQAFTADQAVSISDSGKIAAVIGVEGGHSIENSLEKLAALYHSGMRYMTITWNNSTPWAISAQDNRSQTQGLSDFGRDVIRAMDSLGIIIDVSHTGIKTIQDILSVTSNPIIATHSGARTVRNHYRNLYDWQIIDIANSGGVIGVVFYPYFLNGTANASVTDVIRHIDHIVSLVGVDHVAIGSDFDGIEVVPVGLEDVTKFPALTAALLEHGYTEYEVAKFLGLNFLRVFRQVCGE